MNILKMIEIGWPIFASLIVSVLWVMDLLTVRKTTFTQLAKEVALLKSSMPPKGFSVELEGRLTRIEVAVESIHRDIASLVSSLDRLAAAVDRMQQVKTSN